ncbi:uncharacterized protein LOC135383721 [Ornithodoros turicata]|uniref:uncharacterized protein LOC135383721 n=1 Tax=Ornithodoros turicata TaxID=34597 RepID=UPI0031387222
MMENPQAATVAPPPMNRCVSTQSQCVEVICQKCKSEVGPLEGGPPVQRKSQVQDDSSDSTSETTDSSDDSSKAASLLNAGDARGYGDFVNEDAWLDRMLEQLGLPRAEFQEGAPHISAGTMPTQEASMDPEKDLNDMAAEESYHKEMRDVLWTIVSLKLDDMRLATSQMRAAWKSYVRNTKIVDEMLQNKERTVRSLKEQLTQLKVENKSLKERICDASANL